jgi:hypothetical protein
MLQTPEFRRMRRHGGGKTACLVKFILDDFFSINLNFLLPNPSPTYL